MNNIQKQLFDYSNKVINRNYKVIYYDCTNYFFYTEENDFQKYGISKQHQPLPLVQMGLFMDADGYPFAMNINPGNTSETKTMIPTEKEFLDKSPKYTVERLDHTEEIRGDLNNKIITVIILILLSIIFLYNFYYIYIF